MGRAEREEIARRFVTSAEEWLRKLVHYELSQRFGSTYIAAGNFGQKLVKSVAEKLKSLPPGTRQVDATTFEQVVSIVCHPDHWKSSFEPAIRPAFPPGSDAARFYLEQLVGIRNDVSHGRGCDSRQVEKAICYTNDLTDAIKSYFRKISMDREFDVPMFVQYDDNRGNHSDLSGVSTNINNRIIDWRRIARGVLRPGDTLVAEVEVDATFSKDDYTVLWLHSAGGYGDGTRATIEITPAFVGEQFEISFELRATKEWHRAFGMDDRLTLIYKVLPPA